MFYGALINARDRVALRLLRSCRPGGAYVRRAKVDVFCDFKDETSLWYVFAQPNLRRDSIVLEVLAEVVSGNVFIDVGAHFGFYSRYFGERMAVTVERCRVIALEPDPTHFGCLQRTLGGELPFAVTLLNVAASDTGGIAHMSRSLSSPCLQSFDAPGSSVIQAVECATVDKIVMDTLGDSDRVGLVKIDVDGSEPKVIKGLEGVMAKYRPLILMEFSASHLEEAGESPVDFLWSILDGFSVIHLGFDSVSMVERADIELLVESSRSALTDLVLVPDSCRSGEVLQRLQRRLANSAPPREASLNGSGSA
jgi:FkbM family methyltransferase